MLNILYLHTDADGNWMDRQSFTIEDEHEFHRFLDRVIRAYDDKLAAVNIGGTTSIHDCKTGDWHAYRPAKVQESY